MFKLIKNSLLLIFVVILTSCIDDTLDIGRATIWTSGDITLSNERNSSAAIRLTCSDNWKAMSTGHWLTISQTSGLAGTFNIIVTARSDNKSTSTRKAYVVIGSGIQRDTVVVNQEPCEYVKVDNTYYTVDSEGETFDIKYQTNITSGLAIGYTANWVSISETESDETEGTLSVSINKNSTSHQRSANIIFYKKGNIKTDPLLTISIIQQGNGTTSTTYTSTDYSNDGVVALKQNATIGNGLPIIFIGDGFADIDINNGSYENAVNIAIENLFSEEPIKSLRDYFNIYSVTAISKNNIFGGRYSTALGCKFEGGASTTITGNENAITKYASKVQDIDIYNALVIVLLNTPTYAGTTAIGYLDTNNDLKDFAISFCPVIDSLRSERFKEVIVHEAIGHGFAKLLDEYSYQSYGEIPEDMIEYIQKYQQYNWAQNIDICKIDTLVLWSDFLFDERYEKEHLGIFEGACLYTHGVYRPSENSMMRYNDEAFNAPSRRAIYNFVMERALGYEPTYEEFVMFDTQHKPNFRTLKSTTIGTNIFSAPQIRNKAIPK